MKLNCRLSLRVIHKSPGCGLSSDAGTDPPCFTDHVEREDGDRAGSPPPSPVSSEASEPPQLPMNGTMGCMTEIQPQSYWVIARHTWIKATSSFNCNPLGWLKIDATDIYVGHDSWYSEGDGSMSSVGVCYLSEGAMGKIGGSLNDCYLNITKALYF